MATLLNSLGGRALPDEFPVSVALGLVPGWESFRKFGSNDAVATGTEEMWPLGTSRTLPAAAGTVSVVSSSTADDAAAEGTGAWTMVIDGLDASYNEISETVSLDGQVPVVTTAEFLRVNRMYIVTAGTGEINAGNITASIGGNAQAYIEALEGQTQQTNYTIPANRTLVVTNFVIGVGRMAGSTDLHVRSQIKLFGTTAWRTISNIYLYDGGIHRNSSSVTVIPAKTDVRQQVVSTTTTQAFGIFGGFLVEV